MKTSEASKGEEGGGGMVLSYPAHCRPHQPLDMEMRPLHPNHMAEVRRDVSFMEKLELIYHKKASEMLNGKYKI